MHLVLAYWTLEKHLMEKRWARVVVRQSRWTRWYTMMWMGTGKGTDPVLAMWRRKVVVPNLWI